MQGLYNNMKFIIGFLVIVLICEQTIGDKATQKMCLFVLFSMLILNSNNLVSFLTNFVSESETNANKKSITTAVESGAQKIADTVTSNSPLGM